MDVSLLKKPLFWIALIIVIIIGLLVLVLQSNNSKNLQSLSPKLFEKPKSGPKPGSCLVLEQRYCSQGELTQWKSPIGTQLKLVAFTLSKGTPIFAPFDGSVTYSDGPGNLINPKAPAVIVYKPVQSSDFSNLTFMVTGDIEFNKQQIAIKKGNIIAHTDNAGIKVLGETVALSITRISDSKIITDESLFEKFLNKND